MAEIPSVKDGSYSFWLDGNPKPEIGELVEISPGLLWVRLPLPMRIGSVNAYLLEENDGWAIIDVGYGDQPNLDVWESILADPKIDNRISRIIVTHNHFDHVGAAGWLCARLGAPLYMSRLEYLNAKLTLADPRWKLAETYQSQMKSYGVSEAVALEIAEHAATYPDGLTGLPDSYVPLEAGQKIQIGERNLEILLGPGHSPAQIMLHCQDENWFLSADQVLTNGAPLLIQPDFEPNIDCYELFMASMNEIRAKVQPNALILPGHRQPFYNIQAAICEQSNHHIARCQQVLTGCQQEAHKIIDFAALLFGKKLNGRQTGHAVNEIVVYANHLLHTGKLEIISQDEAGALYFKAT